MYHLFLNSNELDQYERCDLMFPGFLMKDGSDVSQNDLAKFLSFDVTMTSQVLRVLEKRGLLSRSQQESDEHSKFPKLTPAGVSKIQVVAKDFLKAEDSFFVSLGDYKQTFDDLLRGILQQQKMEAA